MTSLEPDNGSKGVEVILKVVVGARIDGAAASDLEGEV